MWRAAWDVVLTGVGPTPGERAVATLQPPSTFDPQCAPELGAGCPRHGPCGSLWPPHSQPSHPTPRNQGMDVYSNILYVKEESAALSHLAHSTALNDKYRTETCCIIGNYHSLKGQHERAAQYFRRALKLNPNCLSAWTLMGHEYVELKNPPAAIGGWRCCWSPWRGGKGVSGTHGLAPGTDARCCLWR